MVLEECNLTSEKQSSVWLLIKHCYYLPWYPWLQWNIPTAFESNAQIDDIWMNSSSLSLKTYMLHFHYICLFRCNATKFLRREKH
jgi:hypothetical protein